jgi:nicotinamide-nucleotide amidase
VIDPLLTACAVDTGSLRRLVGDLAADGATVATAESLTAGLITAVLTAVPGASAVVRGGVVVYATALKATLAGVDPDLLDEVGAVHPEVARQLARGARTHCLSTFGLGVTGVAGPDPQDGSPVGTVFLCVDAGVGRWESAELFAGDRAAVRAATVRRALALLAQARAAVHSG